MRMLTLLSLVSLCLGSACAGGALSQDQPTTQLAGGADGDIELTQESSIDDLLDGLDRAGKDLTSFQANVQLTEIDNDTGTPTKRPGKVLLQRDGEDVMFRATFAGVIFERKGETGLRPEKIEYVLRNDELIDRNYQKKTQVIRKLPPPDGKRDLLKLGEGPFPLPIGQAREEVRKQFDVTEVDPGDDAQNELGVPAAENSRRLRLTPKPGTNLAEDFKWLEIDVGLNDGMPQKVITLNPTGSTAKVTDLSNIQVNIALPKSAFDLEPIDRNEWDVRYEDLSEPAPPKK